MAVNNPARGGNSPGENYRFRCADMGNSACNWEARGRSEGEIMRQVEQHGREVHNLSEWSDDIKNRVRGPMRKIAA